MQQASVLEEIDWANGRITDDALAFARQQIGKRQEMRPWNSEVTHDTIWHFAAGIGDDNPMWWDKSYAQSTSWGKMIAPPGFLYSCQNGGQDPDDLRPYGTDGILPGVLGLWASTRWVWHRPTVVGDQIRMFWELHSMSDPQPSSFAGKSVDQVDMHSFVGADGEPIAEVYRTIKRFERSASRVESPHLQRPLAKYDEADRERFAKQYESEAALRRGAVPRYIEDVQIGDEIGPMLKGPLTVTNVVGWLMGWGSGFCQTNRIAHNFLKLHPGSRVFNNETGIEDTQEAPHWDAYLARQGGYPAGYDFGAQRFSWMMHLMSDWAGDDGFLTGLEGKLLKPNFIGDTTWLRGKVMEITEIDGHGTAVCAITTENQLGQTTAVATIHVRLPSKARG